MWLLVGGATCELPGLPFKDGNRIAQQYRRVQEMGVQVGIVVGSGNILRGAEAEKMGIDRVQVDYAG
jgi:uridylate kinase